MVDGNNVNRKRQLYTIFITYYVYIFTYSEKNLFVCIYNILYTPKLIQKMYGFRRQVIVKFVLPNYIKIKNYSKNIISIF